MNCQVQLPSLWAIAQKRLGENSQKPAVYKIRANCQLIVNTDGETITITIETKRKHVPLSRECFALNPDGSADLTVNAEILSGLTGRISVATKILHCTGEEMTKRNILGYNWMRDQLDMLEKKLSSRYLLRVL